MFNKKISVGLLLISIISLLFVFGCTDVPETGELSDNKRTEIVRDYFDANKNFGIGHVSDVFITHYYGSYNDAFAVIIQVSGIASTTVITKESINGVLFIYSDGGTKIQIWKDGTFYSLQSAYENELLTKSDLKEIAAHHKQANPYLYE